MNENITDLTPKSLQIIGWQELLSRALLGSFFYLPAWLTVCIAFDIQHTLPVFFWLNTVLLAITTLARYRFIRYAQQLNYDYVALTHIRTFLIGFVLFHALHWGASKAFLLIALPHNEPLRQLLFMITAALAGGGAMNYILFKYVGLQYFICIVSIPFAAELYKQSSSIIFYISLSTIFFILIYYLTRSSHSHYRKTYQHFKLMSLHAKTMENLSKLDFLTKLNNRYQFLIEFEVTWHNSMKQQTPLSLLYVDIDNLSKLNHDHGHHAGDKCLSTLANIIKTNFSAPNILARYGSEELMIAMPDTTLPAAENAAQTLLDKIRQHNIKCDDQELSFTCSIGIVSTTATTFTSPDTFINEADKQLQQAQASGHDCFAARLVDA